MSFFFRLLAVGLPLPLFAATSLTFGDLVHRINGIVALAIPIVGGAALLAFFVGITRFILSADETKANEEGKFLMTWGLVAMFVMFSIWGILRLLGRTIGISL